jgi:CheY-like chemotaxis protein
MARILVIDDVAGVRRSIGSVLRRGGHDVIEASDGNEGERLARTGRPDLVIVDLLMPARDGLDTIDGIRAAGVKCPVLAVSGGGALVDAADALAAATHVADATLRKPFETEDLLETVDRLLKVRA